MKYADFPEVKKIQNRAHVTKRRRKIKEMIVELLGGECSKCGYNRCIAALEAHHVDPSTKSFALSLSGLTKSWETIKAEALKCKLLCANCHREEHHTRTVPSGRPKRTVG